MREWVSGGWKDGDIVIHHINELLESFLPMIEMDREILNEKFKEHEDWLDFAAHMIDGQEKFVIPIYDSEKLEFFEFIDGNGFEVKYVGAFSKSHTSLAYVLSVKKCQQEEK